jgi:hypothetical protein
MGTTLADLARDYVVAWVLGRIDLDMKIELCGKVLALPLRFHRDRSRGDLLGRLMGDVSKSQNALELVFDDFAKAAITLPIGCDRPLDRVVAAVAPDGDRRSGDLPHDLVFGRRIRKSAHRRQRQFADVTGRLMEILDGSR